MAVMFWCSFSLCFQKPIILLNPFKRLTFLRTFVLNKMPFYAVARGRDIGIYNSWGECESQVKGYSGAKYKKFNSTAEAQDFINQNSSTRSTHSNVSNVISTSKSVRIDNNKTSSISASTHVSSNKSETFKICNQLTRRMDNIQKGIDFVKTITSGKRTIMIDAPQNSKRVKTDHSFEIDSEGFLQVWTDGACSSNGRNGAKAGIGVFFSPDHPSNVSRPVSGRATNNCGEIQAATEAIKIAKLCGKDKVCINTDSKFLIDSVTKWMTGWKRKNWTLKNGGPVKNSEDFQALDKVQQGMTVKWKYVEAHKGIYGNEMADKLAKEGAAKYRL